ncbi:MAG: ribonuclease HII [Eubacteriales bacterium]|jgi:ribonuclease HII
MLDYTLEALAVERGYRLVCGVDEAGRGPLCGPVVAAACILPHGLLIPGLNDSKQLSEKRREELYSVITKKAISYAVALATVDEINEYNILEATMLAMRRAIHNLQQKPDYALIDGNVARGFDIPVECVVHGDSLSPSIAAASILAKVTRDRLCLELDRKYPGYGIAEHKGYCTRAHVEALLRLGPSPEHRVRFIRFLDDAK